LNDFEGSNTKISPSPSEERFLGYKSKGNQTMIKR